MQTFSFCNSPSQLSNVLFVTDQVWKERLVFHRCLKGYVYGLCEAKNVDVDGGSKFFRPVVYHTHPLWSGQFGFFLHRFLTTQFVDLLCGEHFLSLVSLLVSKKDYTFVVLQL